MGNKRKPDEKDNRWEKLIEHLPVMIFELNLDKELTYLSQSIFDILGYRPEELIGKNAIEFFYPDDRERLLGNIRWTWYLWISVCR